MIRITARDDGPADVTLSVEGRIVSIWGDELERECHRQLVQAKHVRLDFSGVTYIDRRGIRTLRRVLGAAVDIVNSSAVITDLLHEGSDDPTVEGPAATQETPQTGD